MTIRLISALALTSCLLYAAGDEVLKIGPGVTPPKVLSKVNPSYSKQAEAAFVQGQALYTLVVGKNGRAKDIEVISPIGYGLDEKGVEAIQRWVFQPGMKDGMPVNIRAQIEVTFRFAGSFYDSGKDQQRTAYNVALRSLQRQTNRDKSVADIQRLAKEQYPPAMHLLGYWRMRGEYVTRDADGGFELIVKSAAKDYGPAIYELGVLYLKGDHVTADETKGLKMLREAAMLGSAPAQYDLGMVYEAGKAVEASPERARHYFRLCAASGNSACQFRLGRLISSDDIQALAWLQLAAGQNMPEAEAQASELSARMTEEQRKTAEKLKAQLLRRAE